MGKASRKKRVELTATTIEAIQLAAEVIRRPRVLETFLTFDMLKKVPSHRLLAGKLGAVAAGMGDAYMEHTLKSFPDSLERDSKEALGVTPEIWAERFQGAFRNKSFVDFLEACVQVAHAHFWKGNPIDALMFGDNGRPPKEDPIAQAIVRVHRRLASSPEDPRWLSLSLFCLARMIAVNANMSFNDDEWNDGTLLLFHLEKHFLEGRGLEVALLVLRANRDYFDGKLPEMIGSRMLHGLAEAAINAHDAALFK